VQRYAFDFLHCLDTEIIHLYKIMKLNINPFYGITFSVILFLIVSQLIQDGMFMDGSLYVCVSHNLSQGLGTFWEPNYSKAGMVVFREQPPLYFGLMALFFKVFGSSLYVERFFCFVMLCVEVFLLRQVWKVWHKHNDESNQTAWLPIFFYVIIPVVFWAYANLVEETVMVVFATAAVLFTIKSHYEPNLNKQIGWMILVALSVVLSTLTKGIQGSFPIVAIMVFSFFEGKPKIWRGIKLFMFGLLTFTMLYAFIFVMFDNSLSSLQLYLENRLSKAFVTGVHNTTGSHLYLLYRLFSELLPVIGMIVIVSVIAKKYNLTQEFKKLNKPGVLSFFMIGLSGALPLMLTKEQRGFYLVTALPFFAIALALMAAPVVEVFVQQLKANQKLYARWQLVSIMLMVSGVVFTASQYNKTKRDNDLLHDVYLMLPIIPQGEIAGVSRTLADNWSLQNYLIRYKYISSDFITENRRYVIIPKGEAADRSYKKVMIETKYIDLYIKP
jgi:hypothetical protein